MKINSLAKNTGIVLFISIIAKIFSYVWEAVLAAKLGVSPKSDALYMTISVFNILYPILDLGIWKVFLPIYKKKMLEDSDEAIKFANVAETIFFLGSLVLVVFLFIFSYPITIVIAPGFSEELKIMTAEYIRISAVMYLLMTTASIIGAVLQCHNKFLGSQLREIATHVSKIVVFILTYRFWGVYAALIAMIIGSFFRVLVQIPFVDWGWRFQIKKIDKNDQDIKLMLKGLPSVSLTAAISQINVLVDKILASGMGTGAISCLNYGNKLMSVFSGMITTAIATAIYPTMTQYVVKNSIDKLKKLLVQSICICAFFVIPISVFCIVFSNEIVMVAFQRGAFLEESTLTTSTIFAGYAIGMFFSGIATIVTNVYYSFGDTAITMRISILDIVLNIIFNVILIKYLGISGLAVATSLASMVCLFVRFLCLKKYVVIQFFEIIQESFKILVASLFSCLMAWVASNKWLHVRGYSYLFINLILAIVLFFIIVSIMKSKTIISLYEIIRTGKRERKKNNGK